MARPIYPYELNDPDFLWLISNFEDSHPEWVSVESACLPVVFFVGNGVPQSMVEHHEDLIEDFDADNFNEEEDDLLSEV